MSPSIGRAIRDNLRLFVPLPFPRLSGISHLKEILSSETPRLAVKIGVNSATVSRWERGKQTPPIKKRVYQLWQ